MNENKHTEIKSREERRMTFVFVLSALTMFLEIGIGLYSQSMALFADGIHMGAHIVVIGLALGAYILVRHLKRKPESSVDSEKILDLSAYTSGVMLLLFAFFIFIEAIGRIIEPVESIKFSEAIMVALVALIVNSACAAVLHDKHGHDLNSHSAYLHVLADALTSIGTIFALLAARLWDITWVDSIVAIVCALVITKWAFDLLKKTAKSLVQRN